MAIIFDCSNASCRRRINAPDGSEGKRARCPACGRVQIVPTTAGAFDAPAVEQPISQPVRPVAKPAQSWLRRYGVVITLCGAVLVALVVAVAVSTGGRQHKTPPATAGRSESANTSGVGRNPGELVRPPVQPVPSGPVRPPLDRREQPKAPPTAAELVAAVGSDFDASRKLAAMGDQAVPELVKALAAENFSTPRIWALAGTLSQIGTDEAFRGIISTLAHRSRDVRLCAVSALRMTSRPLGPLLPDIISAIKQAPPEAIKELSELLGEIASKAGPSTAPVIVGLLKSQDLQERYIGLRSLTQDCPYVDQVLPILIAYTEDKASEQVLLAQETGFAFKEYNLRLLCVETVARLGPQAKAAGPALLKVYIESPKDTPPPRDAAGYIPASYWQPVEVKGALVDVEALDVVQGALQSKDEPQRLLAIELLPRMGLPSAKWAPQVIALAMNDPDLFVRQKAMEGLVRADAADVLPTYRTLLQDKSPEIRRHALLTLRPFGDRASGLGPQIVKMLKDDDPNVADEAASTLGYVPAGAGSLKALMEAGGNERLAPHIMTALGLLGPAAEPAINRLVAALPENPEAAEALAAIDISGKRSLPPLIKALESKDQFVVSKSLAAIRSLDPKLDPKLAPLLVKLARDDKFFYRGPAVDLLVLMNDPDTVVGLIMDYNLLGNNEHRPWTIGLLKRLGPGAEPAVPRLAELLVDARVSDKIEIISLLAPLGPAAAPAVPVLTNIARDSNAEHNVRDDAISALGRLGSAATAAIETLVELLEDRSLSFGTEAAGALESIGKPAVPRLSQVVCNEKIVRERRVLALSILVKNDSVPRELVDGIAARFDAQPESAAADLMRGLGRYGVPHLLKCLQSPDNKLSQSASTVLSRLKPQDTAAAVPDIIKLLQRDKPRIDVLAQLLQRMGPDARAAAPVLVSLLQESLKKDTQEPSIAVCLAAIDPEAPAVKAALDAFVQKYPPMNRLVDFNKQSRNANTSASEPQWAGQPLKIALPALHQALRSKDFDVQLAALKAATALGPAAKPLLPALERFVVPTPGVSADARLFEPAMGTLAAIGPDALPLLLKMACEVQTGNETYKNFAIEAIGRIKPAATEALPELTRLASRYAECRPAAIRAMRAITAATKPASGPATRESRR